MQCEHERMSQLSLAKNNDNTCVYFTHVLHSIARVVFGPFFCLLMLFVPFACCVDSLYRFRDGQINSEDKLSQRLWVTKMHTHVEYELYSSLLVSRDILLLH